MAAAGIAAELGEDRRDLVGEVDRQVVADGGRRDRNLHGLIAVAGDDLRHAIGERNDSAGGGDTDDLAVGDFELDIAGEVLEAGSLAYASGSDGGGDYELLSVIASFQGNLGRLGGEALHLGRLGQGR